MTTLTVRQAIEDQADLEIDVQESKDGVRERLTGQLPMHNGSLSGMIVAVLRGRDRMNLAPLGYPWSRITLCETGDLPSVAKELDDERIGSQKPPMHLG